MKIVLIIIGKTVNKSIIELFDDYAQRIKHYLPFECLTVPLPKKSTGAVSPLQRDEESVQILKLLKPDDHIVLLDDKGQEFTSVQFATWIEKKQHNTKRLVFIIGGAYGFSQPVYDRANELLSFSRMTFSHQIIRAMFAEQLYRAMTILRGEPYHHEESLLKR